MVIPVYNAEKYIEKCANSLLQQSYTELELLFVDDGSQDQSWQILKKMADTGIPFDYISLMTPSVEMRYGYSLDVEDSLGYDLTVEQLLDNVSVYYNGNVEENADYEEMEAFAENYLEQFHTFVEQYAEAMPEEYPARCRAFASHFQEQFNAFLSGEEVVFPQSDTPDVIPEAPDAPEAPEAPTAPEVASSSNEAA